MRGRSGRRVPVQYAWIAIVRGPMARRRPPSRAARPVASAMKPARSSIGPPGDSTRTSQPWPVCRCSITCAGCSTRTPLAVARASNAASNTARSTSIPSARGSSRIASVPSQLVLTAATLGNPTASITLADPMDASIGSTPGLSDSPRCCRGKRARSMRQTRNPSCAMRVAKTHPAGPAPITATSTATSTAAVVMTRYATSRGIRGS